MYRRLSAERLEVDRRIAADRLEEDRRIAVDRMEADCNLAIERLEADCKFAAERIRHHAEQKAKRKHRRSDEIDECAELKAEMRRVFAERFEEKLGERVFVSDVHDIFEKSTSLPTVDNNVFKYHCRKLFCARWTHTKLSTHRYQRYFTDVAVKGDN
jgi:hypothetical protein